MRRTRVLLDANILFDAQARDLMLRFAAAEQIEVRWSAQIIEEARRNLLAKRGVPEAKLDRLFATLDRVFPGAAVEGFEHLVGELELPDPNDRHVLAAAIHAECDMIVTNNLRDFPDTALDRHDVIAVDLDTVLAIFAAWFEPAVRGVLEDLVAALSRPPDTVEGFIRRLAAKAPRGALLLGAAAGIENYEGHAYDLADALAGDTAHAATLRLMDAIWERRNDDVVAMVDAEFAVRLAGEAATAEEITAQLAESFRDVDAEHGWGFSLRRFPHSPDVEVVRLVQSGAGVIDKPTLLPAYQLAFRRVADGWLLVDLPADA